MKHQTVTSFQDFQNQLDKNPNLFLLIYKKGSEQSDCALANLENIKEEQPKPVFSVNAAEVKDVHPVYHITSAPVIIEFRDKSPVRQLKGCHKPKALESFFAPSSVQSNGDSPKAKQVIVYTTPTCSWCRTLKDYLRNHQVPFREVDVTKDEKAAADMVKRSGQQGVPQSVIDGQVIVGFDRDRINNLLGING